MNNSEPVLVGVGLGALKISQGTLMSSQVWIPPETSRGEVALSLALPLEPPGKL